MALFEGSLICVKYEIVVREYGPKIITKSVFSIVRNYWYNNSEKRLGQELHCD